MGQEEIINFLEANPNEIFESKQLSLRLQIGRSSLSQSLKKLRQFLWVGFINYKDCRFYYYSINTKRYKKLPRVLNIWQDVEGQNKQEVLRYLEKRYGVK